MKSYIVIAEMVDRETGKRLFPAPAGEEPVTFTPNDEHQAERLLAAGCLAPDGEVKFEGAQGNVRRPAPHGRKTKAAK